MVVEVVYKCNSGVWPKFNKSLCHPSWLQCKRKKKRLHWIPLKGRARRSAGMAQNWMRDTENLQQSAIRTDQETCMHSGGRHAQHATDSIPQKQEGLHKYTTTPQGFVTNQFEPCKGSASWVKSPLVHTHIHLHKWKGERTPISPINNGKTPDL
jgi:hypothetical protein